MLAAEFKFLLHYVLSLFQIVLKYKYYSINIYHE